MTGKRITAEWAWIGKEPGSRDDYGVLAASREEVRRFVGRYVAGVPSSTISRDAPGGPPWVTFGTHHTEAGDALISISVQDPWEERDQAMRSIWPQRFFLCPFDMVVETGASYQTLWEAVRNERLPKADHVPLQLTVRPQSPDDLLTTITDIGIDQAAAIAASLLDGPVALAGTGHLKLDDRLAVLDAVAALLPYGFRADLSASSAVDNTVAHKIRLVFAEFPNSQQQAVALRGARPELRPESLDYLHMLLLKKGDSGTWPVISHLWQAKPACSFTRPMDARKILDELDRDNYWLKIFRSGKVTLQLTLAFFSNQATDVKRIWTNPDMEEWMRDKPIMLLLESPDEHAVSALLQNWEIIFLDIARIVNRRLDRDDPELASRSLKISGSSSRREKEDRLLMALLVPEQSTTERWQEQILVRVRLLQQRPVPVPNTFPYTCLALRYDKVTAWQAQLFRELLAREIDQTREAPASSRAVKWATWLCLSAFEESRDYPDWVAGLAFTLTAKATGQTDKSVRFLIRQDTVWAATALRLACDSGHLREVLETTDLDLIDLIVRSRPQPAREELRSALAQALDVGLWKLGVAPGTIAAIDAARVLLGARPRDFPNGTVAQQAFHQYHTGLARAFSLESARNFHANLEIGFLSHAVRPDAASELPAGVRWLLEAWCADPERAPGLAHFVARPQIAATLLRDQLLDGIWEPLVPHEPALKPFVAVPMLREAVRQTIVHPNRELLRRTISQQGVSATRLALAMYEATCSGMSVKQMLDVIGGVSYEGQTLMSRIRPADLHSVIREFHGLLFHRVPVVNGHLAVDPSHRTEAEFIFLSCSIGICEGALGEDFAREFQALAAYRLRDEIASRQHLLRAISPGLLRRIRRRLKKAVTRKAKPTSNREAGRQGPLAIAAAGEVALLPGAEVAPPGQQFQEVSQQSKGWRQRLPRPLAKRRKGETRRDEAGGGDTGGGG